MTPHSRHQVVFHDIVLILVRLRLQGLAVRGGEQAFRPGWFSTRDDHGQDGLHASRRYRCLSPSLFGLPLAGTSRPPANVLPPLRSP
eukprot:1080578-Amorphochlora_amoeboformis.AAC.2